ncbi:MULTISPECIES: glycosyltransferase [unclassified Brachybacterium]|uniref:glycosyltransferase family 2 protein n=1 Tax=unclassified Brachybacterium TaxID=2623841 RepID=UPI00361453DF
MSAAGPLTANRPERVAVVIPAKNEAERIEATIEAARAIVGVDLVVTVDDGSTDATSAVAMGADALVVRHKTNRGKAAAMATGAQMVAIREHAERADGGEDFSEELHAEPRAPGHTGPLPVIGADVAPRALLFLDADMEGSATAAQPLVDAVLGEGVDMAVALLPPQDGAAGMGIVVRTARNGIRRATGWEATQPLSGTRCITRETWEACQPLAPGWGVETSLTIDALSAGFWVKEIEADLHHRSTGRDLRGQLHRAAQLRDVLRALARKRRGVFDADEAGAPSEDDLDGDVIAPSPAAATVAEREEPDGPAATTAQESADAAPTAAEEPVDAVPTSAQESADAAPTSAQDGDVDEPSADQITPARTADGHTADAFAAGPGEPAQAVPEADEPEADAWAIPPEPATADVPAAPEAPAPAEDSVSTEQPAVTDGSATATGELPANAEQRARGRRARRRRDDYSVLPVEGEFSDAETRALGDVDVEALGRRLRALPVTGPFASDDAVYLAGVDLDALAEKLQAAPVEGEFSPEHAVIIASHLSAPEPELPPSIRPPLSPDEYTSLVVHAAVDAENAD